MKNKIIQFLFLILVVFGFSNCGYNEIQRKDEAVKAAWAEVLNQYKRRADLIPQLVKVVEGFAIQEREVLIQVTEARSKVGTIQATPELINNPEAFQKFQRAQGELSNALQRLMVVVERYPELKSDKNFRDLQAQIEGTENRIAVARRRYIEAVQDYNVTIRIFPNVITARIFGYTEKPQFQVENPEQLEKPPEIDFKKK
ncbi:MAG: LemA family protein [Leptospiraceae bacterium]|nr:LemA family protein [Leptospiraceae bacterium]